MLAANYERHFKVLGKLCKLYDDASADVPVQQALLAAFADQYATGEVDSLPAITLFGGYQQQWLASINGGAAALKQIATNAAGAYLVNATFTDDLDATPSATTPAAVLTALAADMDAGADDKTLTVKGATGLANFFDAIAADTLAWNTADPAGSPPEVPDYPDTTYVVATVVAD